MRALRDGPDVESTPPATSRNHLARYQGVLSPPKLLLPPRTLRGDSMAVIVRIPTPLRSLTGGNEEVNLENVATVADVIETLEKQHAGMKDRLLDEKGVRKFINIYVGEEDIRFLDGLRTAVKDGEQISIVPAIAGGARILSDPRTVRQRLVAGDRRRTGQAHLGRARPGRRRKDRLERRGRGALPRGRGVRARPHVDPRGDARGGRDQPHGGHRHRRRRDLRLPTERPRRRPRGRRPATRSARAVALASARALHQIRIAARVDLGRRSDRRPWSRLGPERFVPS